MTPEERSLLQSTHELAKENNELLRKIYRRLRISNAVKIAYWVVIVGISLGAFYFLQPYIDFVKGLEGHPTENATGTQSYNTQLQDLLR